MKNEPRPLSAILEEARKFHDELERVYDVPVLFAVPDATYPGSSDGLTVTSSSAPRVVPGLLGIPDAGIVVPIQPRKPKAASTKYTFGRADNCDVVLPFSAVSKYHGYFERVAGAWHVVDVGSTNGMMVGGKQTARDEPVQLQNGTVLQFGSVIARFLTAAAFVAILRQRLAADGGKR